MFEKVVVGVLSLEPEFLTLVLVTFSLFMVWLKRRSLAKFVPSVPNDFLTRHTLGRTRRYPYGG